MDNYNYYTIVTNINFKIHNASIKVIINLQGHLTVRNKVKLVTVALKVCKVLCYSVELRGLI